ncbi:MAG: hypothetical protein CME67_00685 [Halobacteriovoraceae bacterium]|nr:hypothetical protein [Peredibacter sp.]MBI99717.1 hypothetical protein [Halobacteriovoraceae bacterium]|tara:strand:- start:7405 stop:8718 length:1314 start_codon:yes stop_codon:yes gene_type:complete
MSKVLLLTSADELAQYADLCLNQATSANVVVTTCRSIKQSCELLEEQAKYNLIFLGHKIEQDGDKKALSQCLLPYINGGETVICGTNKAFQGKEWAKYYHYMESPQKLLANMFEELALVSEDGEEGYVSIPVPSLHRFKTLPFDCFIKMRDKYLKVYSMGDSLEEADISKYADKKLECIYLVKEQAQSAMEKLYTKLVAQNVPSHSANPEEAAAESVDYASYLLEQVGISVKNGEQIKASFEDYMKLIKKSRKASLKELLNQKQGLVYKHSSLTALLGSYLLEELDWNLKGGDESLALASYFQNMYLTTDQEILVSSDAELATIQKEDRREVVRTHAKIAETFLVDSGVDNVELIRLVIEQHGNLRGVGFSDKIMCTSKLSGLFQVASRFAVLFLKEYEVHHEPNLKKNLTELKKAVTPKEEKIFGCLQDVLMILQV